MIKNKNKDVSVINGFGREWKYFSYHSLDVSQLQKNFDEYFKVFPWTKLRSNAVGFDMGCGSGRWAKFVAQKVGWLNCVDPSDALDVARNNLEGIDNVSFLKETTEDCSIPPCSQDFGYSLGVLHHIPDPLLALKDCSRLLKPGAPFLVYLYYNFENRPVWFKGLWTISDLFRRVICYIPFPLRTWICQMIAYLVYYPCIYASKIFELFGWNVENLPLSEYRKKSLYQARNDALDRFGTRLEYRFSKHDIYQMMTEAGFDDIVFSDDAPFWCCCGIRTTKKI